MAKHQNIQKSFETYSLFWALEEKNWLPKIVFSCFLVVVMERKKKKKKQEEIEGKDKGWGKVRGTHGDGGSGKKKHCDGCDSFHDFAVGEHDLGILLGDHVKALSQQNCQDVIYTLSHFPLQTPR